MTLRTLVVIAGLATLAGGCTITPVEPRQHDVRVYPYDHRVYRETDSYEGYFYVRIIYIDGIPWYVDDYRRVRPIPRHLHSHFQYSTWVRSLPPRFGSNREMRDGYDISRIVYINDVPHYVDDDRRARPVPDRLRNRFEYRFVVIQQGADRRGDDRQGDDRQGNDRRGDDRSQSQQRYNDRDARPAPPAYGREQERQEPPAYGREREREVPASNGRERERVTQPQFGVETQPRRTTEEQERAREERDRQVPPAVRDGRSAPAAQVQEQPQERGTGRNEGRPMPQDKGRTSDDEQRRGRSQPPTGNEQDRGKSQAVTQPAQPAGDDRKTRAGTSQGDEKRPDAAAEKKNGKAKERGKDRDKGAEDEEGVEEAGEGNVKDGKIYRSK